MVSRCAFRKVFALVRLISAGRSRLLASDHVWVFMGSTPYMLSVSGARRKPWIRESKDE
jgi:hypothetical protein